MVERPHLFVEFPAKDRDSDALPKFSREKPLQATFLGRRQQGPEKLV
jgi:hypothetical protein